MATQSVSSTGPTPAAAASPQLQQHLDNGIWYILSLWPALHVSVQNSWGGPSSSDKRDWFAGAVSDLFTSHPTTDHDDLVVFLLQIMQDEFDCMVEDDSEEEVARQIMGLRKGLIEEGNVEAFRAMEKRWVNRGKMKVDVQVIEEDQEAEWEGISADSDEDGGVDVEMQDAPQLAPAQPPKDKPKPEVDEEGFTTVLSRKKR